MGYGKVGDPGLRNDTAVIIVDLKNPVELAQPQQYRIGQWQCATGQGCASAAWHNLYLVLVAPFHDRSNLRDCFRQHDGKRQLAIGGQAISVKGAHAFG